MTSYRQRVSLRSRATPFSTLVGDHVQTREDPESSDLLKAYETTRWNAALVFDKVIGPAQHQRLAALRAATTTATAGNATTNRTSNQRDDNDDDEEEDDDDRTINAVSEATSP
ncbi:hypothetical protein LTR28_006622, partial [Elasticomyces elasticus]